MDQEKSRRRTVSPALQALAASGIVGFIAGAWAHADWQVAAEPAQVLSGVVDYPWASPAFLYQAKLFTALHQVAALLYKVGFSEKGISIVFSGLLVMVSYQALAMTAFALSRRALLSVSVPLLIHATGVMHILESGS